MDHGLTGECVRLCKLLTRAAALPPHYQAILTRMILPRRAEHTSRQFCRVCLLGSLIEESGRVELNMAIPSPCRCHVTTLQRNIKPMTRPERRALKDKAALEKSRLMQVRCLLDRTVVCVPYWQLDFNLARSKAFVWRGNDCNYTRSHRPTPVGPVASMARVPGRT